MVRRKRADRDEVGYDSLNKGPRMLPSSKMDSSLERIRRAELESLRRWFHAGMRVLEIGGGSGFQSAIMASWGCDIVSIDLEKNASPQLQYFQTQYFTVRPYDGLHLPFADAEFDLVYSSNMLYHVRPLHDFLAQIRRVLRPGGVALHVLPSVTWRLGTSLAHYVWLAKRVMRGRRDTRPAGRPAAGGPESPENAPRAPWIKRLARLLWAPPLGPSSSAFEELFTFRSARWMAAFRKAGFEEIEMSTNGLFYTGCMLNPDMPIEARRRWSARLGSACYIFSMRRPEISGSHG
jgi:SAM-dependent methyltransferase